MAGDWLKIRHDLREDPAVIAIAEITGIEEDHIVGKLHRIWSWADRQTIDGNAPSVTAAYVDRYVNVTGFAKAMESAGWLEITSKGITFPKFEEHISQTAKQRALTARRAKTHRTKSNANAVTVAVTKSAPKEEKRREEKKPQTSLSRNHRNHGGCGGDAVVSAKKDNGTASNKPTLTKVNAVYLTDDAAMAGLFMKATRLGVISDSKQDQLRFWGAACHALRVGNDPAALFTWVIHGAHWGHITADDEGQAADRLKRLAGDSRRHE